MGKMRSTRWYRENEEEVMRKLGLEPTKNSGAGWVEKEDGQNDEVICQLKTTDLGSISVKRKDLETLEYNASVSHKIPVFALQFINDTIDDVWIMVKPSDLQEVVNYIDTGCSKKLKTPFEYEGFSFESDDGKNLKVNKKPKVRSSADKRRKWNDEFQKNIAKVDRYCRKKR